MAYNTDTTLALKSTSAGSGITSDKSSKDVRGVSSAVFKCVSFQHRGAEHPVVYIHKAVLLKYDEIDIRELLDMEQWLAWVDKASPLALFSVLNEVMPNMYSQRQIVLLANVARTQHTILRDRALRFIQLMLLNQNPYSSKILRETESALFNLLLDALKSQKENVVNIIVTYLMTLVSYIMVCHNEGNDEECDRHLSGIEGRNLMERGSPKNEETLCTVLSLCVSHWKRQTCKELNSKIKTVTSFPGHLQDKTARQPTKELQLLLYISVIVQLHTDCSLTTWLQTLRHMDQVFKAKDAEEKSFKILIANVTISGLTSFLEHNTKKITPSPNFIQLVKEVMDLLSKSVSNLDDNNQCWALGQLATLLFHHNKFIRMQSSILYDHNSMKKDTAAILRERLILDTEDMLNPLVQNCETVEESCPNHENVCDGWGVFRHTFGDHDNHVLTKVLCPSIKEHEERIGCNISNERFNELRLLKELQHDHVVQLQAFNDACWPQFYITEDYLNNALQRVLVNKSRHDDCFSLKTLLIFLIDAMEGLHYLHGNNIVHRDLTAANLFISANGKVKLSGLKNARKLSGETIRDFNCFFVPTRWTAPESLTQCQFSKMSDMWMVGHLIYEVLTHGRLPYGDMQLSDDVLMQTVVTGRRTLFEEVCIPNPIHKVILQLTKTDSKLRALNVKDVSDVLRRFVEQMTEEMVNKPFPDIQKGESAADHNKSLVPSVLHKYFGSISHLNSSLFKNQETLTGFSESTESCPEDFSAEVWSLLTSNNLPGIPPLITRPKINSEGRHEISCLVPATHSICSLSNAVLWKLLGDNVSDYIEILGKIAKIIADLHSHNLVLCNFSADTIYIEHSSTQTGPEDKIWLVSIANIRIIPSSSSEDDRHIQMSPAQQSDIRRRAAPEVVKKGVYSLASDVFCFGRLMWWVFKALSEDKASHTVDSNQSDPLGMIPDSEIYEKISDVHVSLLLERPRVCPSSIYSLIEKCWRPRRSERPSIHIVQEHLTKKRRGKSEAIKEYLYDVDNTLFDRVHVQDVRALSGATLHTRSSSQPDKKTFAIRGIRGQIHEALRIITTAIRKQLEVRKEAQAQWLEWVQQAFPDVESRAFFLPPVYISRVPAIKSIFAGHDVYMLTPNDTEEKSMVQVPSTSSVQKSDMREDEAVQRVLSTLKAFSTVHKEVFMCLSQFPFGSYLGEPCFAPAAAQFPLPTNLPNKTLRQGVFDLLLIHKQYGCVICEIKAVDYDVKDQEKEVVKKLTQAIQQLDKAEAMLSHLVSDIARDVRITKTIACPILESRQLKKLISANQQLQRDLCKCLRREDSVEVTSIILCSGHLRKAVPQQDNSMKMKKVKRWWERCVAGSGNDTVLSNNPDLYKKLIARFSGPASTVTVPCITEPRVSFKTWDQVVAYVGDCYTAHMVLFPEQIELLTRPPTRVFIAGPPGTGKTIVLLLMATEWLRQGDRVHVLSIWERSRAATFMVYHMLQKIIATQLENVISPAQVIHIQKNFMHRKDIDTTIDDLALKGQDGPLYVIADEVGADIESHNGVFRDFCNKLLERFKDRTENLHFWAASCHHDVAPPGLTSSLQKTWETIFFTRALRSPPTVIQEIEKAWEIEHCTVLQHSQHTTKGRSPNNVTSPCLKYKDVLILSKSVLREDVGMLKALSNAGIPVRVMKNSDIEDVATARSDVVWAARQHLVQGLERKVVVCLDNYDDIKAQYPFSRLYTMSRCSSKLIVVCPPARSHSDTDN